ncbi:sensor domain-containing phosphodiesterase [Arthrobacter oryzae]|uniref:sensor domain-containing phosphodiesterase n=1 Tax=Arthrobacter oryzae TaxID=409290 RepID=UPI00273B1038|nr:EAL domain-containing protein [Arthrobacter oryzae]WLQ07096.1 EAL domain-containing protein [Arthrobacter oryzae]
MEYLKFSAVTGRALPGNLHQNPSGQRTFVCLFAALVAFALAAAAGLILVPTALFHHPELQVAAGSLALAVVAATLCGTFHYVRATRRDMMLGRGAVHLIDTVLSTSQEWLWAVDEQTNFTFSSRASLTLLGYTPGELLGQPCELVMDLEDLARAQQSIAAVHGTDGSAWEGLIVRCRHRDGSPVWVEASGRVRRSADGTRAGSEGTSRRLAPSTAKEAATNASRTRIRDIISQQRLLTAFQPIHDISAGRVIGVEALSRFVDDDGASADSWFQEALAVGCATELEFAALETGLKAAEQLPLNLYVSLNISPETCLDPRLPGLLGDSPVPSDRIVLELTERLQVEDYGPLAAALEPLRRRGVRIAVDDAGSGFASMRHILRLRPDIIKLDRSLIAGISDHAGQHALGAAMVEFAKQINATIVAEGIETTDELAAVTRLGMFAAQGYLLGRPSIQPADWASWLPEDNAVGSSAHQNRPKTSTRSLDGGRIHDTRR